MEIKRLKQSQKIRIIIEGIGILSTVKEIGTDKFAFYEQNAAVQKALEALEFSRTNSRRIEERVATGISGRWEGLGVQLDILS